MFQLKQNVFCLIYLTPVSTLLLKLQLDVFSFYFLDDSPIVVGYDYISNP